VVSMLHWGASESSCHGLKSQSRQAEGCFSDLQHQFVYTDYNRVVSTCFVFQCTVQAKLIAHTKIPCPGFGNIKGLMVGGMETDNAVNNSEESK